MCLSWTCRVWCKMLCNMSYINGVLANFCVNNQTFANGDPLILLLIKLLKKSLLVHGVQKLCLFFQIWLRSVHKWRHTLVHRCRTTGKTPNRRTSDTSEWFWILSSTMHGIGQKIIFKGFLRDSQLISLYMLYFRISFYFHFYIHCLSRVWRDFYLYNNNNHHHHQFLFNWTTSPQLHHSAFLSILLSPLSNSIFSHYSGAC